MFDVAVRSRKINDDHNNYSFVEWLFYSCKFIFTVIWQYLFLLCVKQSAVRFQCAFRQVLHYVGKHSQAERRRLLTKNNFGCKTQLLQVLITHHKEWHSEQP